MTGGRSGTFAVLEGPKGAGKSTVMEQIRVLTPPGRFVLTKEPTEAFDVRQEDRSDPLVLAEAILADRQTHVTEVVLPQLNAGRDVISDRYVLSTLVFQGWDGFPRYLAMNRLPFGLLPDLTIVLSVEPDELVRRRSTLTRYSRDMPINEEIAAYAALAHLTTKPDGRVRLIDNGRHNDPAAAARTIVSWFGGGD